MALNNLLVPNNYDLYCKSITTSDPTITEIPIPSTPMVDDTDPTQKITFHKSGITNTSLAINTNTTGNRSVVIPDVSDTFVMLSNPQTLSNKSIDSATNTIKVNGTNINSLVDQDVRSDANVVFGDELLHGGLTVLGSHTTIPSSQGVSCGISAPGDASIEISGNANAYIDFTSPSNDYLGRILYAVPSNQMFIYANSNPAIRIDSNLQTTFLNDRINISNSFTPASAAAAGSTGMIAYDTNFIYVCVGVNTWKRVAIATW